MAADGDPVRLRCLAGGTPSAEHVEDAQRVAKLSPSAVESLGPVLQASVLSPVTPEMGTQLSQFCLRHEIAEADLGHVIKVCRWLLRAATSVNLSDEEIGADIDTLFGPEAQIRDVLITSYAVVRAPLREQHVMDALVKHGNVLADVDWRIDELRSDRNAPRLDVSVALVTLAYRSSDASERLTLQLTTGQLSRLAEVFGALAQKTRLAATEQKAPG